jgi:hypothetical protein
MVITARHALVASIAVAMLVGVVPCASAVEDQRVRGGAAQTDNQQTGWDLALTGGFVMSGLVDPAYALGTVPGSAVRVVIRYPTKESTVNLGVAMFAQVYHARYAWLSPVSFGVGIRGDSRATFFVGPGVRFGPHASFVAGAAIGPVQTLPAGVVEGRGVTDTNFLSALGTRTTQSWFAAVTYTFATIR